MIFLLSCYKLNTLLMKKDFWPPLKAKQTRRGLVITLFIDLYRSYNLAVVKWSESIYKGFDGDSPPVSLLLPNRCPCCC
jgi:hypothetical protein